MIGTGCRTILVVDDDENLRVIAEWVLRRLGYGIVGTDTATAAIDLYRQSLERGERFAAVILDLSIPGGMPGSEAIAVLRKLDPKVAAFVMSGDIDDPRMRNPFDYGFLAAISKTHLHETLLRALEKLPDGNGSILPAKGAGEPHSAGE
jgi:CheY-like chemotaxis protein